MPLGVQVVECTTVESSLEALLSSLLTSPSTVAPAVFEPFFPVEPDTAAPVPKKLALTVPDLSVCHPDESEAVSILLFVPAEALVSVLLMPTVY